MSNTELGRPAIKRNLNVIRSMPIRSPIRKCHEYIILNNEVGEFSKCSICEFAVNMTWCSLSRLDRMKIV